MPNWTSLKTIMRPCHIFSFYIGAIHWEPLVQGISQSTYDSIADLLDAEPEDRESLLRAFDLPAQDEVNLRTLLNEACPDDVGPVDHEFTSDGNGSNDASEWDVVDLVAHGFVDQHDGQHRRTTCITHRLNGPRHGHARGEHVVDDGHPLPGNATVLVGQGALTGAALDVAEDGDFRPQVLGRLLGEDDAVDGDAHHGIDGVVARLFGGHVSHDVADGLEAFGLDAPFDVWPLVDVDGELVGLNFDRTIEGLVRDYIYAPERGRNDYDAYPCGRTAASPSLLR